MATELGFGFGAAPNSFDDRERGHSTGECGAMSDRGGKPTTFLWADASRVRNGWGVLPIGF